MSSFPPLRWQVRYLKDMDTLVGTAPDDGEISMEAILAVQPSGGEEGSFRFTLAGSSHLHLKFEVTSIIQDDSLAGLSMELQMELGTQIKLEKNSVTSAWSDMVELVNSQDVDVTDAEGEDRGELFLSAVAKIR